MNITTTSQPKLTQKAPAKSSGKQYIESQIPCHADDYVLKTRAYEPVDNPSVETYTKVCGASGAARGAVIGHASMLVGGAAAGAFAGSALADSYLPGFGTAAAIIGGAAGLVGGGVLQAKTLIGRRLGSIVGSAVGQASAPVFHALGVDISKERAELTEGHSLKRLVKNGGDFFHSAVPAISKQESQKFVDTLKPGDVVLTKHDGSTIFNLLTYIPSGEYDFNHSILYMGDGKAIEATTGKGVHEFDLAEELTHKHHAIAVRTPLEEGQAEKVIEAAKEMKGKPYDYLFKATTNTLYCSELIDHAYKEGAPQVKFNERSFLSKVFVLPGDLLKTDGDVVAEAGEHRSYLNGMSAKFS